MLIYNPRQTVLITCRGKHKVLGKSVEKSDVLPCDWHSPLSSHPPMYSISIKKELMAVSIIRNSGCFVVNFIPYSLIDKIKSAMSTSGEYSEKIKAIGVHEIACEKFVDCFKLQHALGWLECEVVEEKEVGDHILFIGKVVHSHLERDDFRPFHIEKDRFTTTRDEA